MLICIRRQDDDKIQGEGQRMRINKLLSNKGICSRSQAHELIVAGRIKVNGELCIPGQWVEEEDEILLDEEPVKQQEPLYIILNKPVGIECTAAQEVKDNIISYMNYPAYLFPVGRLDKDSQGLILLTNDGDLASHILEAEKGHEKEYIVQVDRPYEADFLQKMSEGVDLGKGIVTRPCEATALSNDTFRIILTQGMNRQIRRMTKAFGYRVVKLERIRLLTISLDDLAYGKWRKLTDSEVEALKSEIEHNKRVVIND